VRNVTEATRRPGEVKREILPLTLPQVDQLLTAIEQDRQFVAVFLGLGTRLRRGELLALRWHDVDLDAALLHVRQTLVRVRNHEATGSDRRTALVFQKPKTRPSRRRIPIPHDIVVELKAHKARQAQEKLLLGQAYQDHGLVFCLADGRPWDPRNFTRHFDRLLQQAGLPHIRFHDARHTFTTVMLDLKASPKAVQELLGHSKSATTMDIYAHVSLEVKKQEMGRLNHVLRRNPRPSDATGG
jgi:integrase